MPNFSGPRVLYDGLSIQEWCQREKISPTALHNRLNKYGHPLGRNAPKDAHVQKEEIVFEPKPKVLKGRTDTSQRFFEGRNYRSWAEQLGISTNQVAWRIGRWGHPEIKPAKTVRMQKRYRTYWGKTVLELLAEFQLEDTLKNRRLIHWRLWKWGDPATWSNHQTRRRRTST